MQGDVELDIDDATAKVNMSAGKLTHQESLDYESTFKGVARSRRPFVRWAWAGKVFVGPIRGNIPTEGVDQLFADLDGR